MKRKFKVITLCGSSKFKKEFIEIAEKLSLEGNIVISLGLFGHADNKFGDVITDEVKEMLDAAHRQKIKMSDAIYVINPGGYIGMSTRREIHYARALQKEIMFLEEPTFKFKGVYHTYGNLMRALSDRMIEPDGGDIYFVISNNIYGEKEAVDIYGEPLLPHSFVAYNPDMCGFYRINLTDAKISLKDPYPYLGDKTSDNHILGRVVPDDIYISKAELDEAFDTATNSEEPKDYSLSTEILKNSTKILQDEIDSEINNYTDTEKQNAVLEVDNEGLCGTFETYMDLFNTFRNPIMGDKLRIGDRFKIVLGGGADMLNQRIIDNDIIVYRELGNGIIGFAREKDDKSDNIPDILREDLEARISEVSSIPSKNDNYPSPYPRDTLISKYKLRGIFSSYSELIERLMRIKNSLKHKDLFQVNGCDGGEDMYGTKLSNGDVIAWISKSNGLSKQGWMKISSENEIYVNGAFESFEELLKFFNLYNKLPKIGDRFEILKAGGYDFDKTPIEAGDIVEYQLETKPNQNIWRKVEPKIIDLDTI